MTDLARASRWKPARRWRGGVMWDLMARSSDWIASEPPRLTKRFTKSWVSLPKKLRKLRGALLND